MSEAREETKETKTPETARETGGAVIFGRRWSDETIGFASALISAPCYSASLFCMRGLTEYADVSSDWSLVIKEMTTVVCIAPFILIQYLRGRYRFPTATVVALLLGAGVMCQLVGARPHFWSYAAIGLALSTPLVQALQLIGTSAIGAFWLKEKVTKTKASAILTLILAVALLGMSQAGDGTGEIAGRQMRIGFGLFCVFCAALGYSSQMTMMRKALRDRTLDGNPNAVRTPTTLAMVTVTGVGALVFAICLALDRGVGAFVAPPAACWGLALGAGIANMIGFYFQIEGVRRIYASKSTLVAASQTIVLSALGIAFFGEPLNAAVVAGLTLVAVGVALAGFSK
jgi:drug/metabolite transporter (DMT)-like permease